MKYLSASLCAIAALLLLGAALSFAQDASPDQYLQKVSLYAPAAQRSIKDDFQLGKAPAPLPSSTYHPFSYIPHDGLAVPPGTRVMIFVPHPDDESIAASGLIQRVLEMEGKVSIVFVTNGDGYAPALRMDGKKGRLCAKDFVEYGKKRQREAAQAACELGLQPEDLLFLGFPDTGIDDLWESNWSNLKPFISPFTLFDRPHRRGVNRWVNYSGVELREEMERVIREFSPDWVVLPDPRDFHPDHSTAGIFVLEALRNIYQEGQDICRPSKVLTYLVHFKDYPDTDKWAKQISAAPVGGCSSSGKTLANTSWEVLALTSEEMEGKRRALLSHASQLQMLNWFFKNFLLPGEIFGSLDVLQVLAVPQECAAYSNHPSTEEDAEQDPPVP